MFKDISKTAKYFSYIYSKYVYLSCKLFDSQRIDLALQIEDECSPKKSAEIQDKETREKEKIRKPLRKILWAYLAVFKQFFIDFTDFAINTNVLFKTIIFHSLEVRGCRKCATSAGRNTIYIFENNARIFFSKSRLNYAKIYTDLNLPGPSKFGKSLRDLQLLKF